METPFSKHPWFQHCCVASSKRAQSTIISLPSDDPAIVICTDGHYFPVSLFQAQPKAHSMTSTSTHLTLRTLWLPEWKSELWEKGFLWIKISMSGHGN